MYSQEDLDQVLGELHQGPIGLRKEWQWQISVRNSLRTVSIATRSKMSKSKKSRKPKNRLFTTQEVIDIRQEYRDSQSIRLNTFSKKYSTTPYTMRTLLTGMRPYCSEEFGPTVKIRTSADYRQVLVKEVVSGSIGTTHELASIFDMSHYAVYAAARRGTPMVKAPYTGLHFVVLTQ